MTLMKRKKNIDKGQSFPGFNSPVGSIFEGTKSDFESTWQTQIYNRYFRSIFVIGLDYCKFLRVHVVHASIVELQALQVVPLWAKAKERNPDREYPLANLLSGKLGLPLGKNDRHWQSRPSVSSSSETPTQGSRKVHNRVKGAKNLWVQTGCYCNMKICTYDARSLSSDDIALKS